MESDGTLFGAPSLHFEPDSVEGRLQEMDGASVPGDHQFSIGPLGIFVSADHPSVPKRLGEGALDLGLDLTGISMLPGTNQDNWTWSSAKFGFVYESVAEGEALIGPSTVVEAAEKAADFVKESQRAQQAIKQYLKSKGTFRSMKSVAQDAALAGKVAGAFGIVLAGRSAYDRYTECRGY